ncbi:MAG TPA: hypothetical protein VM597_00740 [Gemmataceae bacterium]|jgi:hypothetical protein|nr:hypothetical protein [Gemmataceae bacterium]
MLRINPDPHTGGYVYVPTRAVTARFPAGSPADDALKALDAAGFGRERVDVFTGEDGARKLDAEGRHHGWWVRFRKTLEETFADDADVFHRADQTLRTGGTVVEVFTHGDKGLRARAAEILKTAGGQDVIYWGPLMTEYM